MAGANVRVAITLALIAALATCPAVAETIQPAQVQDSWFGGDIFQWLTDHAPSNQMALGILIGLAASEALRFTWRTLEWLLFTVYVFAKVTARYGAIAAIVGCVLYLI